MIILPDRNIPRSKVLLPVARREWCVPSQAQPKNILGHENQTRFSATARLNDGHIVWRGWFDDRDDFDAFIWSFVCGDLHQDRTTWRLPTPWWHPDIFGDYPDLSYEFVTTVFIVSGATFTVPSDSGGVSGQSGEFIDTIGAGGSGGLEYGSGSNRASGGGGGAWSRITSLHLSGGSSVSIGISTTGGAGVSRTSFGSTNGNKGGDTWFNGSSALSSSVGAQGGGLGTGVTGSGSTAGGVGGATASGTGTSKNAGGAGGSTTASSGPSVSGGGGAGGLHGAGVAGTAAPNNTTTAGGAGDNGSGGAGSSPSTSASSLAGSNGSEYDASHGSGGASGGVTVSTAGLHSGAGGNYGGGTGGFCFTGTSGAGTTGTGGPGLIVYAYVPGVFLGRVPLKVYLRR